MVADQMLYSVKLADTIDESCGSVHVSLETIKLVLWSTGQLEPHADVVWSVAADQVYRFGSGGALISFCRRRRRVLFTGGAARRVGTNSALGQNTCHESDKNCCSLVMFILLSVNYWWCIRQEKHKQISFQHKCHAIMSINKSTTGDVKRLFYINADVLVYEYGLVNHTWRQ